MRWMRRFGVLTAAGSLLFAACTGEPPTSSGVPTSPGPTSPSSSPLDGDRGSPPERPVTVSGPSPFAGCTEGAFNDRSRVYPNSEVEPSVAVDPTDPAMVLAAFQQDRWSDGGARGIVAAASDDAGRTWTRTTLPMTTCARQGSGPSRASDPWVSIGPDGTAYLIATAVGDGVRIATSTDGGNTWPHIERIPVGPDRTFADKTAITADPTRPGVAYAVWNEDERAPSRPRDTLLSETTDGGRTWSSPRVILEGDPDGGGAVGVQVLVDARAGRLYHIYNWQPFRNGRASPAHVGIQVSNDGGASWSESRLIDDIRMVEGGTKSPEGRRIRSGAGVIDGAVDPASGTLYLVWEDARFSNGRTGEVALSVSTDDGVTWTAPRRISPPTVEAAFTPMAEVDETGRLAVSLYAIRGEATSARTDVWVLRSEDAGASFQMQTVDGPFDLRTAPDAGGLFLGDYAGLASGADGFAALYAVTTGDPGSTDVRAAFVP